MGVFRRREEGGGAGQWNKKGLIYWHVMTYRLLLAACHDLLKNQVML